MSFRNFLVAFFLVNLIISSFYLDSWRNPNSTSRVLQVASLSEKGTFAIDEYEDQTIDKAFVKDQFYPLQPPWTSIMVWPVYEFTTLVGITNPYDEDEGRSIFLLGGFLTGSLPFALLITLLLYSLHLNGMSLRKAVMISMLGLYGSMYFIYAGVFYSHLLVAFCIGLSYHFISRQKYLFWSGILSGAAFFSEYLTAVIFAVWFFQMLFTSGYRSALLYGLGLLPFVGMFLAYNWMATGNPLLTVYSFNVSYDMEAVGFTYPRFDALWKMSFGTWRGALFYRPGYCGRVLATIDWRNKVVVQVISGAPSLDAGGNIHARPWRRTKNGTADGLMVRGILCRPSPYCSSDLSTIFL